MTAITSSVRREPPALGLLFRNGANFNRLMAIYESVVRRPIRAFMVVS